MHHIKWQTKFSQNGIQELAPSSNSQKLYMYTLKLTILNFNRKRVIQLPFIFGGLLFADDTWQVDN